MKKLVVTALLGLTVGCEGAHDGHGDAGHDDAGQDAALPPESVPIEGYSGDAVFVVNGGDATISVLDPADGASLGTILLRNVRYPHHINLSPDRRELAIGVPGHDLSEGHSVEPSGVAHEGHEAASAAGAVLVLDATNGSMLRYRALEAPNHNAIFSADGQEIWTALLRDEGEVLVLDARSLQTLERISVGRVPAEITFSLDGRYAFVANGSSDSVTIIDASTKQVVATVPVDAQPVGAWPGADGAMYVDCEVGRTLDVIDPDTLTVVRSFDLGFTPGIATVPPGRTDELWVTNADDGKIVFGSTDAPEPTGELPTGRGAHAIAFSPDGRTAFVTNQEGDSVSIVDAESRTVRVTVPVGSKPNGVLYRTAD